MSLILHIETAVEGASVCLSDRENILATAVNPDQKESAGWLHPALQQLIRTAGVTWKEVAAVAVSAGPGSYTGLRVGLSSAKGLCFALNIPLLCISTLKVMAAAAGEKNGWLCPMIDARRMEVFTALYDQQLHEIVPVSNLVLSGETFSGFLRENNIYFFGNGSKKFRQLLQHQHAHFIDVGFSAENMVPLAYELFKSKQFSDVAYSEPVYGKEFYSTAKIN